MKIDLETLRREIDQLVGVGSDTATGTLPYTPRVKKALKLAAQEAQSLHHTYVGTEHLLLGLLRDGDNLAARVLIGLGVGIGRTRQGILAELDPNHPSNSPA
jgi:ATP-dependent Clp protease ATP-binding subunit ClpC